jgi:hypothetical protein
VRGRRVHYARGKNTAIRAPVFETNDVHLEMESQLFLYPIKQSFIYLFRFYDQYCPLN